MSTSGKGFLIIGRLLGMREEAVMEMWTVRPLYQAPPGVAEASEGG